MAFKVGDRVRIDKPGSRHNGEIGTVDGHKVTPLTGGELFYVLMSNGVFAFLECDIAAVDSAPSSPAPAPRFAVGDRVRLLEPKDGEWQRHYGLKDVYRGSIGKVHRINGNILAIDFGESMEYPIISANPAWLELIPVEPPPPDPLDAVRAAAREVITAYLGLKESQSRSRIAKASLLAEIEEHSKSSGARGDYRKLVIDNWLITIDADNWSLTEVKTL